MPVTTLPASPSPPVSAPPPARDRMLFLDALRGVALVLMVVNHTARWWIDASMGLARYQLIYATVTLPAAIFLFLVGYCLPLSVVNAATRGQRDGPIAAKLVRRGAGVVLAGILLNALVFPEDPLWSGGVLQTIGQSIIVATPLVFAARRRWTRPWLIALAVLLYAAFVWAYPMLTAWLPSHRLIAQIWFFDFAPWPWISMVLIGLAVGWSWVEQRSDEDRRRYMRVAAMAGVLCVLAFLAHDWWFAFQPRISFRRDFSLNRHWIPRGVTTLWIVGMIACLGALAYYAMEVRKLRLSWLVALGQTALMLYFLHQVLVYTVAKRWLGVAFHDWWLYTLANVVLVIGLVYLARAWLVLKPALRGRLTAASSSVADRGH